MQRSGFSLLELSIVLVIIGLLAGGVMVGQDLVRQSELKSVITDFQKFVTARNAFKNKYSGLPGDFRDATRYWGRLINASHCATNSAAAVATSGACDGNGDGVIIDFAATGNQSAETFQFWRHLALAGMVEGSFSGLSGATNGVNYEFGVNAPGSRVAGAGWAASHFINTGGGASFIWNRNYNNWYTVGSNDGSYVDDAFISPAEAYSIDQRMDDGKPATGMIQTTITGANCNTASSNSDYQAAYSLSNMGSHCALMFRP